MENKIFELAARVTKPISLASIIVIALYLTYRIILGMDIFTRLGEDNTFQLLTSIADMVFYLALVSLVLGIVSFSFQNYVISQRSEVQVEWTITGNVFFSNGTPIKGAIVFVEGVDRRKETDENGWFSIAVNRHGPWVIHGGYNEHFVRAEIGKEDIHETVRLTIPDKNPQVTITPPPDEQDEEFPSPTIVDLLNDPDPFLRIIKQHLSKQPAGRDRLEPIVSVLAPVCQNNQETAKLLFHQLVYEQYLNAVAGNRYELSLKAHNKLSKGRT